MGIEEDRRVSVQDVEQAFRAVWSSLPGSPDLDRAEAPQPWLEYLCARVPLLNSRDVSVHVHIDRAVTAALVRAAENSLALSELTYEEALADTAGELANQLAGALKVFFGSETVLSTPLVDQVALGDSERLSLEVAWQSPLGCVAVGVLMGRLN